MFVYRHILFLYTLLCIVSTFHLTSSYLRCAEFPDCPGDQVWDGAQCADLECDPRETPSYSLTGQDNNE